MLLHDNVRGRPRTASGSACARGARGPRVAVGRSPVGGRVRSLRTDINDECSTSSHVIIAPR